MKRTALTLCLLVVLGCGAPLWGGVDAVEYFFDVDPGEGSGIQIYSRDPVEISQLISTAALDPGLHRLFIRGRNETGQWGLPHARYFLLPETYDPDLGTIARLEYFFDSDPGPGNGIQLYSRDLVDVTSLIDAAALSPGMHKLLVRARNADGFWGLPHARYFLLPPPPAGIAGTITHLEYFFDSDPGQGNGIQIYSRNSVDLTQLISASDLDMGLHRFFLRGRNNSGLWGLSVSRNFFKAPPPPANFTVTRLEYFLDSDPGFGNGTQLSLTAGNPVSVSVSLPFPGVSDGIHRLYVRGRNNQGQWGFSASALFSNGIPADLVLTVVDGAVTLSWTDLPGVDSYVVHSAELPQGPYLPESDGAVPDAVWTHPGTEAKRFYRVTSIYQEP